MGIQEGLSNLPKVAWKWGSWKGGPPFIKGSSCASTLHKLFRCFQLGLLDCCATPLSSWCPSHAGFPNLEGCFLENPVKRESSREGVHFTAYNRWCVQLCLMLAYLWDAQRMGDHMHCPAAEFLPESSSLHCVTVMWSLSTLLACQDLMKGASIPQTWGNRIKAIIQTTSLLMLLPFLWVSLHDGLQCLLFSLFKHHYLKVTAVYWTLLPCAILWANCVVTVSLILYSHALRNITVPIHRWKTPIACRGLVTSLSSHASKL